MGKGGFVPAFFFYGYAEPTRQPKKAATIWMARGLT